MAKEPFIEASIETLWQYKRKGIPLTPKQQQILDDSVAEEAQRRQERAEKRWGDA
jgi:hypothetical protein